MFGLFRRDPRKKLRKAYEEALKRARDLQRNGDVASASHVVAEAEQIRQQLEELENE